MSNNNNKAAVIFLWEGNKCFCEQGNKKFEINENIPQDIAREMLSVHKNAIFFYPRLFYVLDSATSERSLRRIIRSRKNERDRWLNTTTVNRFHESLLDI